MTIDLNMTSNFLPFNEARTYVKSLKLKSREEWSFEKSRENSYISIVEIETTVKKYFKGILKT